MSNSNQNEFCVAEKRFKSYGQSLCFRISLLCVEKDHLCFGDGNAMKEVEDRQGKKTCLWDVFSF